MNDTEHQKKDEEINNTGLGKAENNTQEQDSSTHFRNKLIEDLQMVCHTTMSKRERLPTLKENSKLIKLEDDINGITDELLEDDKLDLTDINNFICTAATIMTQKVNQPSKRGKIRRNENSVK